MRVVSQYTLPRTSHELYTPLPQRPYFSFHFRFRATFPVAYPEHPVYECAYDRCVVISSRWSWLAVSVFPFRCASSYSLFQLFIF